MKRMIDYIGYDRIRRAVSQFWKYCLVGTSGFLVNMLVFWLMISGTGAHYWIAGTVSFSVAVTNNFILNRHWTFGRADGAIFSQARRFLIISISSWALNMAMLRLLIEEAHMNQYLAQIFAISMVTGLNFLGNKLWSFRQPTA
ncbi:MAG: GtrA family protein [Thermoleophilia bacterium]|nr:GtrA family protein [Thermoleophilia bacterium]